jgi:hypothetical protein
MVARWGGEPGGVKVTAIGVLTSESWKPIETVVRVDAMQMASVVPWGVVDGESWHEESGPSAPPPWK